MATRDPIAPKLRYEVLKRDGFTCQYCGSKPPDVTLVIDHIDPVTSGGSTALDNLITACVLCNQGKGGGDLTAFDPDPLPLRATVETMLRGLGDGQRVNCPYCVLGHPEPTGVAVRTDGDETIIVVGFVCGVGDVWELQFRPNRGGRGTIAIAREIHNWHTCAACGLAQREMHHARDGWGDGPQCALGRQRSLWRR